MSWLKRVFVQGDALYCEYTMKLYSQFENDNTTTATDPYNAAKFDNVCDLMQFEPQFSTLYHRYSRTGQIQTPTVDDILFELVSLFGAIEVKREMVNTRRYKKFKRDTPTASLAAFKWTVDVMHNQTLLETDLTNLKRLCDKHAIRVNDKFDVDKLSMTEYTFSSFEKRQLESLKFNSLLQRKFVRFVCENVVDEITHRDLYDVLIASRRLYDKLGNSKNKIPSRFTPPDSEAAHQLSSSSAASTSTLFARKNASNKQSSNFESTRPSTASTLQSDSTNQTEPNEKTSLPIPVQIVLPQSNSTETHQPQQQPIDVDEELSDKQTNTNLNDKLHKIKKYIRMSKHTSLFNRLDWS